MEVIKATTLNGCTNFSDFEKEYDDIIFYADGGIQAVIDSLHDEGHSDNAVIYEFDGWFIAILAHHYVGVEKREIK